MKHTLAFAAGLIMVVLATAAAVNATGVGAVRTPPSGAITIQSWLHATPSANSLSGTVLACFKLKGVLADQGGQPTWTDNSYTNAGAAATQCGDESPVGGFVFVPTATNTLATVYAVHTISGRSGQIYITFSGVYNLGPDTADLASMQGAGTWVITGGTGGYNRIEGQGTWKADASLLAKGQPYIRHTETGQISFNR